MRAEQSMRRLVALRQRLLDLELDGLVVTSPENIRYLSGFTGSLGYLVIAGDAAEILGDSRYWLQMEAEAPAFRLMPSGPSHGLWALVAERIKALGLRRGGFESPHPTFHHHHRPTDRPSPQPPPVATPGPVQ